MSEPDFTIVYRYITVLEWTKELGLELKVDTAGFQICDGGKLLFHSIHISEVKAFCTGYSISKKKR